MDAAQDSNHVTSFPLVSRKFGTLRWRFTLGGCWQQRGIISVLRLMLRHTFLILHFFFLFLTFLHALTTIKKLTIKECLLQIWLHFPQRSIQNVFSLFASQVYYIPCPGWWQFFFFAAHPPRPLLWRYLLSTFWRLSIRSLQQCHPPSLPLTFQQFIYTLSLAVL